jgi:hypothetical protein
VDGRAISELGDDGGLAAFQFSHCIGRQVGNFVGCWEARDAGFLEELIEEGHRTDDRRGLKISFNSRPTLNHTQN